MADAFYLSLALYHANALHLSAPLTVGFLYDTELNFGEQDETGNPGTATLITQSLADYQKTYGSAFPSSPTAAQEQSLLGCFTFERAYDMANNSTWNTATDQNATWEGARRQGNMTMSSPIYSQYYAVLRRESAGRACPAQSQRHDHLHGGDRPEQRLARAGNQEQQTVDGRLPDQPVPHLYALAVRAAFPRRLATREQETLARIAAQEPVEPVQAVTRGTLSNAQATQLFARAIDRAEKELHEHAARRGQLARPAPLRRTPRGATRRLAGRRLSSSYAHGSHSIARSSAPPRC